jgi:hypothetical protein
MPLLRRRPKYQVRPLLRSSGIEPVDAEDHANVFMTPRLVNVPESFCEPHRPTARSAGVAESTCGSARGRG